MDRILIFKKSFAKRKITAIALCFMLAAGIVSCDNKPCRDKQLCIKLKDLRGTHWRLAFIAPNGRPENPIITELTILEPQDCDTCFTLTFDAKRTGYITGISILNTVNIQIFIGSDYPKEGFPEVKVSVTELDEPFDGNLYSDFMRSVTRIAFTHRRLDLSVGNSTHIFYHLEFERITH